MLTWINDFSAAVLGGVSIKPGTDANASGAGGEVVDLVDTDGQVFGVVLTGSATGTPTTYALALKLQEDDADDGGTATDMEGGGYESVAVAAAAPSVNDLQVHHLKSPLRTKRYARIHHTVTFAGGSTPTVPVAGYLFAMRRR